MASMDRCGTGIDAGIAHPRAPRIVEFGIRNSVWGGLSTIHCMACRKVKIVSWTRNSWRNSKLGVKNSLREKGLPGESVYPVPLAVLRNESEAERSEVNDS